MVLFSIYATNGGLKRTKINAKGAGDQCDQIGRLFNILGNKFTHKISFKYLVTYWAILKKNTV